MTDKVTKSSKVQRDFGSFHSSNVEEQVLRSEDPSYCPPESPVPIPTFDEHSTTGSGNITFGKELKKKHFLIDQNWLYLNHGAFGSALKETIDFKHEMNCYIERQSLKFLDRDYFPQVVKVQKNLAKFVGCSPMDITLTPNVTFAINSVLNSLPFTSESSVYFLNITYGATKKMLKHLSITKGVKLHEECIKFPIKHSREIEQLVRNTLKPGTTLAVIDHISSNYAFTLPVCEIINICHERNVKVLIDGAHALGTLPIDLQKYDAEFYVTNTHKWMLNAKGCAMLYVKREYQHLIHPVVISHGYGSGFHSEFMWTGLNDYSSFLSLQVALNFWSFVGADVIRNYNTNLLRNAVKLLVDKWDGRIVAPIEMHNFMCCVSLPKSLTSQLPDLSYDSAEKLQNILHFEHFIEVPLKSICGDIYVRLSAHIYNEIEEYEKLADVIVKLSQEKL